MLVSEKEYEADVDLDPDKEIVGVHDGEIVADGDNVGVIVGVIDGVDVYV